MVNIMETILKEKVKEIMSRYEERRPDVVYAHMLDNTIFNILTHHNKVISGEMITGEILHQGVSKILEPAEEKCRELHVSTGNIVTPALERFIKYDSNGQPYVEICGQADAVYENYPVELKTTRSSKRPSTPKKEWVRRAKIYGWLYGREKAYLVIFNIITGVEMDHIVRSYSDEEMKEMIEKWLRGEFPNPTLYYLSTDGSRKGAKLNIKRITFNY